MRELTQRVVDTSRVVANTLRGPVTNKHTASVHDLINSFLGILDLKDEVFRGILVADAHGLFDVLDLDSDGVSDRSSDDIDTRKSKGLFVNFVLNGSLSAEAADTQVPWDLRAAATSFLNAKGVI